MTTPIDLLASDAELDVPIVQHPEGIEPFGETITAASERPPITDSDLTRLMEESGGARRAARRLLRDEHLAEDAVQQAWVSLLQSPPRDRRRLGAWFSSVTQNAARKALRGRHRAMLRDRSVAKSEDAGHPSVASQIDRATASRSITAAVVRLKEPYRSTIIERYFIGRSLRELAKRDDVPIATLRSRLQRAHIRLRIELEHQFGDRTRASQGLIAVGGFGVSAPFLLGATFVGTACLAAARRGMSALRSSRTARVATACFAAALGIGVTILLYNAPNPETLDVAQEGDLALTERASAAATTRAPSRVAVDQDLAIESQAEPALTVRVLHTEDGEPAVGARIRAISWGDPAPFVSMITMIADDDGVATLPATSSGPTTLLLDAGSGREVLLDPESPIRVSMRMPVGVDVHGSVQDASGRPAANRAIWLSTDEDGRAGSVVTQTDSDGAFELRDVPPGRRIGAVASAYHATHAGSRAGAGPSKLATVSGSIGTRVRIPLRLTSLSSTFLGSVRGPGGDPARNAVVLLETIETGRSSTSSGALPAYPPTTVRTGEDGTFRAAGLAPGPARVWVRATDAALSHDRIQFIAGNTFNKTISLESPSSVHGRITDHRGFAVPGALVRSRDSGGSLHGAPISIFQSIARSDAHGNYRLIGLASGETDCEAIGHNGIARTALRLTPGVDHRWNAELGGRALVGRVVNPEGLPIAGALVGNDTDQPLAPQARTGPDGRFLLSGIPNDGGWIRVTGTHGVPWGRRWISPNQRSAEIHASDPAIWGASVSFAIDTGGLSVLAVRLSSPSFSAETTPGPDQQVRFQNLPPGDFGVVVETDIGPVQVDTLTIAANEQRTLDTIVVRVAGEQGAPTGANQAHALAGASRR